MQPHLIDNKTKVDDVLHREVIFVQVCIKFMVMECLKHQGNVLEVFSLPS